MRIGMFTYGMGEHLTGIGRYTQELCSALTKLDKKLEIILVNPYPVEMQSFFGLYENHYVPSLRKLPAVLTLGPVLIPAMSRKLGLDIIHDPCGISPFLSYRGSRAARRVVTIHDAVPYVYPEVQPFLTRLTFRTFVPAARWNVDAILTDSESSRCDLIRHVGFAEDKVHVAHLGVFIPSEKEMADRKQLGQRVLQTLNVSEPYFLYVGALNPRKNVPRLISAFERVLRQRPDVKLIVVGPKTWWAHDSLQAAYRLRGSIFVTGFLSDEELGGLYANASAFVYPSLYEGFGLPPLEAMAHQTPVITSNVSSLPEVVGDAALMVDPEDVSSLAVAMLRVLCADCADGLSRKGRLRAGGFHWQKTASQTLSVYERILN